MTDIDRIIRLITDWRNAKQVGYEGANNVLDLLVELREARQDVLRLRELAIEAHRTAVDLGLEDLRRKIEKVMNP